MQTPRELTLEDARSNLQEAVELVLEANRVLAEEALDGRTVLREPFVIVCETSRCYPASRTEWL